MYICVTEASAGINILVNTEAISFIEEFTKGCRITIRSDRRDRLTVKESLAEVASKMAYESIDWSFLKEQK